MTTLNPQPRAAGRGVVLFLSLLLTGAIGVAQTNDGPKILFLHVRVEKEKSIKLVESSVRDGELKPQPNTDQADGIHYELRAADGSSLWHGVVPDPSRRVVEFEDPPRSGKLKHKLIELPEMELTVRVPVRSGAQRVEFYNFTGADTNGVNRTNHLGSVTLPKK
ncbi:MAG: hypothetical protein EXS35_01515 [Pedosphaera sp.]|nr:hypothetical protein [Pedosphaera sp.]